MFNPTPQARPVPAAVDLACGIGLNDQNLFTSKVKPSGGPESARFLVESVRP